MNVLAISDFWVGLIDRKTQEEREGIYDGWGLAGIVVITLVLLLFYW